MVRKAKRDLTMEEQLARGPLDLPFLMLVLFLLGIGLVMLFSASYYTAYRDPNPPVSNNPYFYITRQAMDRCCSKRAVAEEIVRLYT